MRGVKRPRDEDEALQPGLVVTAVRLVNDAMNTARMSQSEIGSYLVIEIHLNGADSP